MGTLGIIVASHGEFAKAALGSANMIVGETKHARALALTVDKSAEQFEEELIATYEELKPQYDNILFICDIYGGTPFNVVSRCLLKGYDMIAYTGLSLPLLIDALLINEIDRDELDARLKETHSQVLNKIEVELPTVETEVDLDEL